MNAKIPHLPEEATHVSEHDPLIDHSSEDDSQEGAEAQGGNDEKRPAGGTILGIHNLAIVMPQFIVGLNLLPTAPFLTLFRLLLSHL
jgi:solute carrier family 45 protein 1/2/4